MGKAETASTTELLAPLTTPQPKTSTALRTAAQVLDALQTRYDGVIDLIDGFKYIPWHVSNDLANAIFGYLGWSSTVVSCDYTECDLDVDLPVKGPDGRPIYENNRPVKERTHMDFRGFRSIVRVEVQVWDEGLGMVIRTHHDGVGYGPIQAQGAKNPMDGATKSAKSDGISTAIKHFGDAFGLFLYEKENKQATSTPTYAQQSTGASAPNGTGPLSPAQAEQVAKKFNTTLEHVAKATAGMSREQIKPLLDRMFAGGEGNQPWKLSADFGGLQYVKKGDTPAPLNATPDRLPIPA